MHRVLPVISGDSVTPGDSVRPVFTGQEAQKEKIDKRLDRSELPVLNSPGSSVQLEHNVSVGFRIGRPGFDPRPGRCVCFLEQETFTPQKVLVIPRNRWLRLNMTEKLFTGTLNHNKKKKKKKEHNVHKQQRNMPNLQAEHFSEYSEVFQDFTNSDSSNVKAYEFSKCTQLPHSEHVPPGISHTGNRLGISHTGNRSDQEHGSVRTRHHSDVSRSSRRDSNTRRNTIPLQHADPGEHSPASMIRHCPARSCSRSYDSVSPRRHSRSASRSRGKKKSHKKRKHASTSSSFSCRSSSSSTSESERERKRHKSKKKKKEHSKSHSSKRDKSKKKHKRKRSPSPSPSPLSLLFLQILLLLFGGVQPGRSLE